MNIYLINRAIFHSTFNLIILLAQEDLMVLKMVLTM